MLRLGLLTLIVFAGGCTTMQQTRASANSFFLAQNPYDTIAQRPDILLTAGLEGRLSSIDGCIVIKSGGATITPLWPEGTRAVEVNNITRVILPDGRGESSMGVSAHFGGAMLNSKESEDLTDVELAKCPKKYFAVSTLNSK